jgi:hypothetical protein
MESSAGNPAAIKPASPPKDRRGEPVERKSKTRPKAYTHVR